MAPNFEPDLYDSLSNEVEKLRDLGKSWGLDETEIDQCVQRALVAEEKPTNWRRIRRSCFWFVVGIGSLMCCMSLFVTICTLHKSTRLFVTKHSQGIAYPLMRSIRLVTLPIARRFDLRGWHEMECLLGNPLFFIGPSACNMCEDVNDIQVFTQTIDNFTEEYYNFGTPFVVKDSSRKPVSFDDLKALYLSNKADLEYNAHAVECTNGYVRNINDILNDRRTVKDILDTNFALQWRIIKAGSMRLIRGISPKPYFIPVKGEVASEMFIFIDSPASEAHTMPQTYFGNTWLTQTSGSREVTLAPLPTCRKNCTDVSVALDPGDILFYSGYFWQLSTFPVLSEEVSIQFMGSFF